MALYERTARDLSEELFNAVYDDMFQLAEREQKAIYVRRAKSGYYVGECQETLNEFCKNKLSLGAALDFIKTQGLYIQ